MQYRNDHPTALLVQTDPPQLLQPGDTTDVDGHVAGLTPLTDPEGLAAGLSAAGGFAAGLAAATTGPGVGQADVAELHAGVLAAAATTDSPSGPVAGTDEAAATAAAGATDQGVTP